MNWNTRSSVDEPEVPDRDRRIHARVAGRSLEWLESAGIETALIDLGKPWQSGADESFNGCFRDECPSLEWFRRRRETKVIIETWHQHHDAVRPPHSSLDYRTPTEFRELQEFINRGAIPK
jgi:transposase InsO family protein